MTVAAVQRINMQIEAMRLGRSGIADAASRALAILSKRIAANAVQPTSARTTAEAAMLQARLQHLEAELQSLPPVTIKPRVTPTSGLVPGAT
jgi:hypothetical protein